MLKISAVQVMIMRDFNVFIDLAMFSRDKYKQKKYEFHRPAVSC